MGCQMSTLHVSICGEKSINLSIVVRDFLKVGWGGGGNESPAVEGERNVMSIWKTQSPSPGGSCASALEESYRAKEVELYLKD